MAILSYLALGLYGLVCVVYFVFVFTKRESVRRLARILVGVTLVCHLGSVGAHCLEGFHPLLGISSVMNLIAFLLAGGYLLFSVRYRLAMRGAVLLPLCFALVLSGLLTPRGIPAGGLPVILGKLHLTLVAIGVTVLTLASAVAMVYLRQVAALRGDHLALLDRQAPALDTLDRLSLHLTLIGFPLFALAIATGIAWALRATEPLGFRVEYALSGIILLDYLVLIVARLTIGLRGRRAALLTLIGFSITASVLAIYMVRRLVG